MGDEFLGETLPTSSFLSIDEYREMYAVVNDVQNLHILRLLKTNGPMTSYDIRRTCRDPAVDSRLKRLFNVGLINRASKGGLLAYKLNALGEAIARRGAKKGIQMLMREEQAAESGVWK